MWKWSQRPAPKVPSLGLVGKFALVGALPVVVIGVVLAHVLGGQISERGVTEATRAATLVARVGIQPKLRPDDLDHGLGPADLRELDEAISAGITEADIVRVKLWNRRSEIVYSDDHGLIGKTFPRSPALERAFAGEAGTEVTRASDEENAAERRDGRLLEVYVPLRFRGASAPEGAFEIYVPYGPIAAVIERDRRALYLLLLAGLVGLYGALLSIAVAASKKLRRQSEANEHQALHDGLTALPNRMLFRDRLQQAIATARREGHEVGVMLMDLDRFKEVNDTLGHESGDLLLRELAVRLRSVLRESDTVARLGGDEFALLLPRVFEVTAVFQVAERIGQTLEQPFLLRDVPIAVEASIGIAIYPDHGFDVDTLIQRADVAMYMAKAARGGYALYEAAHDEYSPSRLRLVAELRRAIDDRELTLHYQPKQEFASGEVVGVEALVRWQHPERGCLPPSEFIPLAQHTNLIKPLTLFVLDTALAQCRAWRRDGLPLRVAVNLSTRSLLDLDLADDVAALLAKHELEPDSLELEITETTIMADPVRAAAVLSRLNELGVRIAIDDFGTGYSSLSYLSSLPVDEIKIDRSFVVGMSARSSVIVRSTIDLGRNLGLAVVAEGVETEDVWRTLRDLGCDAAQGYFLSRPLPADKLAGWLRARAMSRATELS